MRTLSIFLMSVLVTACYSKKVKETPKKPNIVFLYTDDQTYTAVHALGNKEIITPNLDKLVKNGTTFTHTYNMGAWNGAVCLASRAMINSGRFVWRAKEMTHKWKKNQSIEQSWSMLMQGAGYETYMTGKWHVDAKANKIFNHTVHIRPGMPGDAWNHKKMVKKFDSIKKLNQIDGSAFLPVGYGRPTSPEDTSWSPSETKFGGFWEGGKHWSEVVKDDAIGFINQASQQNKPYFMYLAFNAPHDPRQAPQKFVDMYPLKNISVPKSYQNEYPYRHGMGNGNYVRDEALAPFPRTPYAVKVHLQEYYASITHLDEQIGLIIEALKKSGTYDNTYIILTSDHGLAMGRHGFMGKQNLYDHSIRPPMIISGPGIPKNNKVDADIYLQDAMATSLELAGVQKPDYVEFNSYLDLAKGTRKESHYDAIYGGYMKKQRMIRKDGYKLLVYPLIKKVRLYHVAEDVEEMNDLSEDPAQKERIKILFKDLMQLQKNMGDDVNLMPIFNEL